MAGAGACASLVADMRSLMSGHGEAPGSFSLSGGSAEKREEPGAVYFASTLTTIYYQSIPYKLAAQPQQSTSVPTSNRFP
jgi:hypothetical protein